MVKEKPTTPPPPHLPAEGNRPPETSLTETVLLSPPSSTTDRRNLRLIRIEFTTKRRGKDSNDTTNNEPLQALLKKGTLPLFEADPNLKLHPITDWPANFTTASSSVKPAPNTEQHITNNTEKTTENKKKSPIITTPDTLPIDRIGLDKYVQYTSDEHHPGEAKKIVIRICITTSKTVAEFRKAATPEFLQANHMWFNESNFDTLRESTIGWFLRVHPDATNRTHYASHLHDFLSTHSQYPDVEDEFTPVTINNERPRSSSEASAVPPVKPTPTCPHFTILKKRTGVNLPTQDNKKGDYISVEVLQIRCETVHSKHLQNILAAASVDGKLGDQFIPYSVKATDPSLYIQSIQAQQLFLKSTTAIRVDGFSNGGLDLPLFDDSRSDTLRSIISSTKIFMRVDETVTSFRSRGRALFVVESEKLDHAVEFLDITFPKFIADNISQEQREIILLPGPPHPTRFVDGKPQSDIISVYTKQLNETIPPLLSVEFVNSGPPSPSSNTNAWKKKRNPIFFLEKKPAPSSRTGSSPNKTTLTSDTSVAGESTNTAPTLATQHSQTEALIDRKLAAFRTEFESSLDSKIGDIIKEVVSPLLLHLERLSFHFEQVVAQNQAQAAALSVHTQIQYPPAPQIQHHQRYDDNISVHSQSPGRPLPPPEHYNGHPNIHPKPQHSTIETHRSHASPPHSPPLISDDPDFIPDSEFSAQHQHSYQSHADRSMAEQHTMTDPDQSVINRTMNDQNQSELNLTMAEAQSQHSRSPSTAPKGILKITSDKKPSGGASN
jgi:hypothetical protein